MTVNDVRSKIDNLKFLMSVYNRLLNDEYSTLFGNVDLRILIKKTNKEIEILEELVYNKELEGDEDVRL